MSPQSATGSTRLPPQASSEGVYWSSYVPIPFEENGRGRDGCDCWGLVQLVYRENYGIELPDYRDDYGLEADERTLSRWYEVEEHRPGDVVLSTIDGTRLHVGVVVRPGIMLNTRRGVGTVIECYETKLWKPKVIGVYRYRG